MKFRISQSPNKKYDVYLDDIQKWLPFGDKRYAHFKTSSKIPKSMHIYEEHGDEKRRNNYRSRASKITDKFGNLTFNDPKSPNFYSYHFLW
jgi:hypothetical protein